MKKRERTTWQHHKANKQLEEYSEETTMIELEYLDEQIKNNCPDAKWIFRIGSSLHPDWFQENSDIDYLVVMDDINREFINQYPDRISPELPAKVSEHNTNFYWRISISKVDGHPVTIVLYSTMKFLQYCNERSPPKMYLLHEHKLIKGDPDEISHLKTECAPNRDTAKQDLKTLQNPRYATMWPWAWRSVSILENGLWLKNKAEIEAYVKEHHPGKLHDKEYLKTLLIKKLS